MQDVSISSSSVVSVDGVVQQVAHNTCPFEPSFLVAVSGGVDSMTLLHVMALLCRERTNSRLECVHVNHKLRPTSDRDARLVESVALEWGVPFHLRVLPQMPPKVNLEAWARQQRYEAIASVQQERGLLYALTAHHANDVVETYLMRLCANKEPWSIESFDPRRQLIRPMLGCTRTAIEDYAKRRGISFEEDESNRDSDRTRNRVRHKVVPLLAAELGSSVVNSLYQRALQHDEDLQVLTSLVDKELARISTESVGSRKWVRSFVELLKAADARLRWRIAERYVRPLVHGNVGRVHGERIVHFFFENRRAVELPGGWRLFRRKGAVVIERARPNIS